EPRMTLVDTGETIRFLYFPHSAVVCLMAEMRERGHIETATIGPEGVVGFEVLFGRTTATHRAIVQIPGPASRIGVRELSEAAMASDTLRAILMRYVGAFVLQVMQSVACNATHRLEARYSRWLLMAHDRAGRDEFHLTQAVLAEM